MRTLWLSKDDLRMFKNIILFLIEYRVCSKIEM